MATPSGTHISNAGRASGPADPSDEAPAGVHRFSDFVDTQASGGGDEADEPTDPRLRFTDWIDDAPIDTTYHDHVGPVTNPRSRSGR